jgi:hypothetical protein
MEVTRQVIELPRPGPSARFGSAAEAPNGEGSTMDRSTITIRKAVTGVAAAIVAAVGFAACGDDDDEGAKIDVTLSEWIVQPDPASARPGEVEFVGDNKGGETHELVVARADSIEALPTDDDGAVDEEQFEEGMLIGEIEDIESNSSKSVKLDLLAGTYVLFCNITEEQADGTIESHFAEGMHSTFQVA